MNHLISMFIDDELTINDKVAFVEAVHAETVFKDEAVELLNQEEWLRSEVVDHVPDIRLKTNRRGGGWHLRRIYALGAALVAAVIFMVISVPRQEPSMVAYRFVIFQPEVTSVDIAGTFTGWSSIPLKKTGKTGYWEATLEMPAGEHRLCYIIEGEKRIPDPTILAREADDFGGENSILQVVANRS